MVIMLDGYNYSNSKVYVNMDILKNKQYKNYDRLSRYAQFPIYYNTLDDKYITATTTYLSKDTPYKLYQAKSGETYDLIALKEYNNPTYYWVICDFNNIQDPFSRPYIGQYLKIPVISKIEFQG